MMMTALNPGEELAVPRNAHKSAMGGLIMSGAYPVWMAPEVDDALHMDHTVTPETVRATLDAHPLDQSGLHREPDVLRRRGRSRSDRAHRARRAAFRVTRRRSVGPALPFPSGAARSTRSRRAPTCASIRRTRCSAVSRKRRCCIKKASACASTVSKPSSNCSSRHRRISCSSHRSMSRDGRWRSKAARSCRARSNSRTTRGAGSTRSTASRVSATEEVGRPGVFDLDPTKITITVKELGYTGYEAEEILRRRSYNVQCELADLFNCLALFTIGTTQEVGRPARLRRQRTLARGPADRRVLAVGRARAALANRVRTTCRKFRRSA